VGSGDIYRALEMTWYRSLPSGNDFAALIWDGNGTITALRNVSGSSHIDRYTANQVWVSEETYAGIPLALFDYPGGYLLVGHSAGQPIFTPIARSP
jgi:hypothetical protein